MKAGDEISVPLEPKSGKDIGRFNSFAVILNYLAHWTSGRDDLIGRQPFSQQITTRDRAVCQIDIRCVIDDSPIDFFRHPEIKTAISSFHVENRDLPALGRNGGQTTVCVTEN